MVVSMVSYIHHCFLLQQLLEIYHRLRFELVEHVTKVGRNPRLSFFHVVVTTC